MSDFAAYELLISNLPEDELGFADGKRVSVDGLKVTFDSYQRTFLSSLAQSRAVQIAANQHDWRNLVNSVGEWRSPPTAEELEQQRQSDIEHMKHKIDLAVEISTDKYVKRLRGQEARYNVKVEDAEHGIVTGEFRRTVTAAMVRWNMDHPDNKKDELGMCHFLVSMRDQYHNIARKQEAAREEGYAAAIDGDSDGVQDAINEIESL